MLRGLGTKKLQQCMLRGSAPLSGVRAARSVATKVRMFSSEGGGFAIQDIKACPVIDSRGTPTVEAVVHLENGTSFRSIVPSGASTGEFEALEMRDGGKAWKGKGVSKAVENIHNTIAPGLKGMDPTNQRSVDEMMIRRLDGSRNQWYVTGRRGKAYKVNR